MVPRKYVNQFNRVNYPQMYSNKTMIKSTLKRNFIACLPELLHHSRSGKSFSGQLVTSEIIMASESGCPIEFHRIDVDKCDPVFDKECQGNKYIPFLRADYDRQTGRSPNSPREQVIPSCLGWILPRNFYEFTSGRPSTLFDFHRGR